MLLTLNVSTGHGQKKPQVEATAYGVIAVHRCRCGDAFGVGKRWDLTHIPTGNAVLSVSLKRKKDAVRLAKLFDRVSPLENNPRATRLYNAAMRWWRKKD